MCFWNNVEKGNLFIKTPFIFENAKIFSTILLEFMKKKQGRTQTQPTVNLIPLREAWCYRSFEMVKLLKADP